MKVISEVWQRWGDWGTRWVLSLFGATQLVKVDSKNGPSSWQGFSLQRQSASQPLSLGWASPAGHNLCLRPRWAQAARLPNVLQLTGSSIWVRTRVHEWSRHACGGRPKGRGTWFLCHPGPRPAKPHGIRAARLTVNTEYSQPRLREEWTSWAWPKLQTHRTVS